MFEAAIFDADGTLLDSMHIWSYLGACYLGALGVSAQAGLSQILEPMTLDESSAYLKRHYGLCEPAARIKEGLLAIIADFYRHEVRLKPGALELLQELNGMGVPMAMATSGERELIEAALRRLQADRYFKAVFTCSELNTSKREALIYRMAAEFLGAKPRNTAVFEDALFALETASGAGFVTVAVADRSSEKDRARIRSISDLYMDNLSDTGALRTLAQAF